MTRWVRQETDFVDRVLDRVYKISVYNARQVAVAFNLASCFVLGGL